MILNFKVDKQTLSRADEETVVINSIHYLKANFTFSNEWEDCTKLIASFNESKMLLEEISDDETVYQCSIPFKSIHDRPYLLVSVTGINEDTGLRITSTKNVVFLKEGGYNV